MKAWLQMGRFERAKTISSARQKGRHDRDIAASLGVHISNFRSFCARNQIRPGQPLVLWRVMSVADKVAEICRLRDAGQDRAMIAEALGVRMDALARFCSGQRITGVFAPKSQDGEGWKHWSKERRRQEIVSRAESGESAAEIGRRLGITRNAVLGFRRRNGFSASRSEVATQRRRLNGERLAAALNLVERGATSADINALRGAGAHRVLLANGKANPGNAMMQLPPALPVHPLPPPETWLPRRPPIGLMELNEHTCRWPIEIDGVPAGYCGDHVHKKSFCEAHYAVAYRPTVGV